MESHTLARPYALAAYDVAKAHEQVSGWESALTLLAAALQDSALRRFVRDPRKSAAVVLDALLSMTSALELDATWSQFLTLLLHNRRLFLVEEIAKMYAAARLEDENVVVARIVTAMPLSDAQQKEWTVRLTEYTKRKVQLLMQVDPNLLGGAVIYSGDTVVDGSLKTQLVHMAKRLNKPLR